MVVDLKSAVAKGAPIGAGAKDDNASRRMARGAGEAGSGVPKPLHPDFSEIDAGEISREFRPSDAQDVNVGGSDRSFIRERVGKRPGGATAAHNGRHRSAPGAPLCLQADSRVAENA